MALVLQEPKGKRLHGVQPWSRRLWLVLIAASVFLGVALRCYQISTQVVGDDETHALRALLGHSYFYIFSHFFDADICIPQTLITKLIADTVGLDEVSYRAPALVAGLVTLLVVPWFVVGVVGLEATGVFALLLAISPLLTFYTRTARPYAISTALVFAGLLAFYRFLEDGGRRSAVVYVSCGIAAIYFHLLAAPAVLAPLIVGLWLALGRSEDRRLACRRIAELGGAIVVATAILLLGPLITSADAMTSKVGAGSISWNTVWASSLMFAGTGLEWVARIFWGGVGAGIVVALRRHPRLTVLMLVAILAQLAFLALVSPSKVEFHWIFARYHIWVLPFVLLFLSIGLAELRRLPLGQWGWPLPMMAAAALAATLYFTGPLRAIYYAPNNFTNHNDFQIAYGGEFWRTKPGRISRFYRQLKEDRASFEVVEAPWYYGWGANHFHHYQKVHKKPVRIGFVGSLNRRPRDSEFPLDDPRLRFGRYVDLADLSGPSHENVRYVILHKDFRREMGAHLRVAKLNMGPVIDFCQRAFGPPVFEDETILVFERS